MSQMIAIFTPLLAFMLIPLWIPLAAIVVGKLADLVGMGATNPMADKIEALKASHREARAEVARADVAYVD